MARPPAKILLQDVDYEDGRKLEIITGTGMYFVTYQDAAFNMRVSNEFTETQFKYPKVAFPNKGHALKLAKTLNERFNTTEFSVIEVE